MMVRARFGLYGINHGTSVLKQPTFGLRTTDKGDNCNDGLVAELCGSKLVNIHPFPLIQPMEIEAV